ncbi:MAG: glycosyltransferase family 4 protein [Planctomycetota bacterium]
MRIALLSHEYPPFRGGGIGTYATLMAREFAAAGIETHVITNKFRFGSDEPVHRADRHRDGNLWVHRVEAWTDDARPASVHGVPMSPMRTVAERYSEYLVYAELIADAVEALHRELKFDVLEAPECAAESFGILRRRRLGLGFADLPVTVCCHSPIEEIYTYNLYSKHNAGFYRRKAMEESTIVWADGVHSPSALMGRIVSERLGLSRDAKPWDVLPLPMDFARLPKLPPLRGPTGPTGPTGSTGAAGSAAAATTPSRGGDAAEPTLLFVGRLEPRKGVRYMVDAASKLMATGLPNLRVRLVGKDCDAGEAPGGMVDFLRSRIPARFRDRFEFPGLLPRDELFAMYRSATACVFAPEWDNFPYTCVEAMASGACVVGSDYSGIAEMVEDGRSGLLFRAGDVGSLTGTIRRAVTDRALNASIREWASARIRRLCDPSTAVEGRVEHYERVIAAFGEGKEPARSAAPPPSKRSMLRVGVFVPRGESAAALEETLVSLEESAGAAACALGVTVLSADADTRLPAGFSGVATVRHVERGTMAAARALWREEEDVLDSEMLVMLHAGDTLAESAVRAFRARLRADGGIGWISAWQQIGRRDGWAMQSPSMLLDFQLPLAVFEDVVLPPMFVRTGAIEHTGWWNDELGDAFGDLDLAVAMEEHGFSGEVLPLWLIKSPRRQEPEPPPPDLRRIYVEKMLARSPGVFAEHGSTLWAYDAVGEQGSFAAR